VKPKITSGLLVTALVITPSQVMAGTISGSAHDFSISAWSGGKICVACHVPHNAMASVTAAPLWNHTVTTQVYTVYSSSTLKAVMGQPAAYSKLCLSCHDGTVAVDSYNGATGTTFISTANKLGTDLNVHHPTSFLYDTALAAAKSALFDPAAKVVTIGAGAQTRTGTISSVMLYSGQVECSTCHDVHNTFTATTTGLLKISMSRSAMCFTCHNY
jgi:predicted CXXCH cytochrome family protein